MLYEVITILRTVTEGQKVYNSPALNNKRKYYDLRNTMSELAGIYEKFIYGIGTSENPQVIADEINRFSDKLEKIIPVIEHIYGQYPELKNIKSVPDELREVFSVITSYSIHYTKLYEWRRDLRQQTGNCSRYSAESSFL